MTTPTTGHPGNVLLEVDQAEQLAFLLQQVEDWLRHASGEAREELACFLGGTGNGLLAAAGLVDLLGAHTAVLQRRIKEARP